MWLLKKEELSDIIPLLTSSYYLKWTKYLATILAKSRDVKTVTDPIELVALQIGIARELEKAQKAIKEGLEKKREAEVLDKTDEAKNFDKGVALNMGVVRLAKGVMDGISWRVLGFDRPFLRLMAGPKKYSRSVDLSDSYLPTQNIAIQLAKEKQSLVLLSDLTNYLRYGDIVEIEKDGRTIIHELKTKYNGSKPKMISLHNLYTVTTTNKKMSKQELKIAPMQIARDQRVVIRNTGSSIPIREVPIKLRSNLNEVGELIRNARSLGICNRTFDEYLGVEAMCSDKLSKKYGDQALENLKIHTKKRWPKGDLVIPLSNLDFFHEKDGNFIRNGTPYAIFPFPPQDCMALISGEIWLISKINVTSIQRLFEQKGWEVTPVYLESRPLERVTDSEDHFERDETLFWVKKGPFSLSVPFTWISWVGTTFLHPDSLVDLAEYIYTHATPGDNTMSIPHFSDEKRFWV